LLLLPLLVDLLQLVLELLDDIIFFLYHLEVLIFEVFDSLIQLFLLFG
jgi:hypothetical protein